MNQILTGLFIKLSKEYNFNNKIEDLTMIV